MGHARAILGVSGQEAQAMLARRVVQERLSVRQCEELVRSTPTGADRPRRSKPGKPRYSPVDRRLVEALQRRLGTKVDLRRGAKGGRLVIHYYSPEELNRLVATIEGR
jgi:ParB family chromosome partitioning protein